MRAGSAKEVLPRYSNGAVPVAGPMVSSPRSANPGAPAMMYVSSTSQGNDPAALCDAVMLDIETGTEVATTPPAGRKWFRSDSFTSKTAVFSQLGSAVSSLSSRCRGALLGSSLVTYIHRVPALDKPFDLKEIRPGEPNEGIL